MSNDLFLDEFATVEIEAETQPPISSVEVKQPTSAFNVDIKPAQLGLIGVVLLVIVFLFVLFSLLKKKSNDIDSHFLKEDKRVKKTLTQKNKLKIDNLSVSDNIDECIADFLDRTK